MSTDIQKGERQKIYISRGEREFLREAMRLHVLSNPPHPLKLQAVQLLYSKLGGDIEDLEN